MRYRYPVFVFVLILFSTFYTISQGTCSALVEQALEEMGDNCAGIDRNSACYGYNRVDASFATEDLDEDFFSQPADFASLTELETIRTTPMSIDNGVWGVALMSVQANVPNTLPGQAVTFVLLGDVEVENAVDSEEAFTQAEPIEVPVLISANVRSGPGLNFNIVTGAAANTSVIADGLSEDGEWVRIVHRGRPGWINRGLLEEVPDLESLPAVSTQPETPMQAFYLQTGIGAVTCDDAPADVLVVQGPDNISIDLNVNGADIHIGSTILIKILPPGDIMEISVIDGEVIIDQPNRTVLRTGEKSTVCLSEPDSLGVQGDADDRVVSCDWSEPEPMTEEDIGGWCVLGDLPEFTLNYRVPIDCEEGLLDLPPSVIPPPPAPSDRIVDGVNCTNFRQTSPLGSSQSAYIPFYWDPAVGADNYEVVFYNELGERTASFITPDGTPNIGIDTGIIGIGSQYTWEVIAYKDGSPVCSTGVTEPLVRDAGLTPDDLISTPDPEPTETPTPVETPDPCEECCEECQFEEGL